MHRIVKKIGIGVLVWSGIGCGDIGHYARYQTIRIQEERCLDGMVLIIQVGVGDGVGRSC